MKVRLVIGVFVVAAVFFAIGRTTAQNRAKLHPSTLENLTTAMHGEAFAHAKYMLYAEHARKSGHTQLAKLFEKTARTEESEHFREEASLASLVGSNVENLRDAIQGESYEVDTMYREFAEQAKAAGDSAAAERFEEIRHDEMKHRDAYRAELAKLQPGPTGESK